jgi:Tol biopolymer transport system component
MRIRAILAIFALASLLAAIMAAQQSPANSLLEQARTRKAAGDLQSATEGFEKVVTDFAASDRNAAAKALLELGAIAETLSQSTRARTYFERVRIEYADQRGEAAIATDRLAAMDNRNNPAKIVIKTPYTEDAYSFAISPDGRTIVFQVTPPDGKRELWRQAVDASSKPEPIEGTEGAGVNAFPFFSPDGRSIAFFAKQKLWQVDLAGGKPRELMDAPTPNGGDWGKSGAIVISARGLGGSLEKLQDGRLTPLTQTPGLYVHPKFVDDSRFLYFARDNRGSGRLELGSLDGPATTARPLPAVHAAAFGGGYLFIVTTGGSLNAAPIDPRDMATLGPSTVVSEQVGREGRLAGRATLSVSPTGTIAYREAATVKKQMRWMDRSGEFLGTVGQADGASATPRVSPDERFVLIFRQAGAPLGSVWLVDTTNDGAQRQFRDAALSPVWSTNGDRIMYSALQIGPGGLRPPSLFEQPFTDAANIQERQVGPAAGVQGRPVGPASGVAFPEDWASNGFVLYRSGVGTGNADAADLFVFPPYAGDPIVVAQTPALERNARFSPDGNWIAYQSDESGRNEVYVQPFPGTLSQRQRVSLSGGTSPQWGRKGRELYFIAADNRMMIAAATPALVGDRRTIEFATPKPLFGKPLPQGTEYDTVRDGDRFLVMMPVEESPPIIVLTKWGPQK